MVRTVSVVALLSFGLLSWASAASAQAPPPPGANPPRGPLPALIPPAGRPTGAPPASGTPAAGAPTTGEGVSGVLRVMIPDAASPPAATPTGTGVPASSYPAGGYPNTAYPPAAPPTGSGRPEFRSSNNSATDNDPTVPNAEIRRILEGGGRDNTAPAAPVIPPMRVRARVFVSGRPPVAVLEIGGRQLTVREGSEIHLLGGDSPVGMQLKVARMTTSEIRLEIVNRNQFITLD